MNNKKVLIVEDEPPVLSAIVNAVRKIGFTALPAEHGEKGLDIGSKEHPDLVVLDVIMPKMHGVDMYKRMRLESWGKNIPVVFLTNYSEDPRLGEISKEPHCELLSKTEIKLDDLIRLIQKRLA